MSVDSIGRDGNIQVVSRQMYVENSDAIYPIGFRVSFCYDPDSWDRMNVHPTYGTVFTITLDPSMVAK